MGKKLDRAFDVMRERNRRDIEKLNQQKQQEQQEKEKNESRDPSDRADSADSRDGRKWDELTPEEKAKAFHAGEEPGSEPGKVELEKGDLPAMIISALLVFGPVFLVLFGILALAWVFLH
ncbi:MAG: hypothetical protein E7576_03215 [Ruminococcaceae bacterium]|nr:hypothetical protein [Oscillospiraceae bacterium]